MIGNADIALDLLGDYGNTAIIRSREAVIPRQDHLDSFRRQYWGDWDPLTISDVRCQHPRNAVPADLYRDSTAETVLVSLRRLYNYNEQFLLHLEATTRNGFENNTEEWFEFTVRPRIATLTLTVTLPKRRRLVPGSAKARFGYLPSYYNEYPLEPSDVRQAPDGRDQLTSTWHTPTQHWSYSIRWQWVRI